LTRSERKAKHVEANKQLWDAAERPERSYFLESKGTPPLKDEFKPQLKVLSRKPQPALKVASRADISGATAGLSIDDEEDSEEEARRKNAESLAERQRRAALDREEKQRKYAEVRQRLFGPAQTSEGSQGESDSGRSSRKGRGQGARGSQQSSSTEQSPARGSLQVKQLFDPSSSSKPRAVEINRATTPQGAHPVRQPRGPDAAGKGGFGSGQRGGRVGD